MNWIVVISTTRVTGRKPVCAFQCHSLNSFVIQEWQECVFSKTWRPGWPCGMWRYLILLFVYWMGNKLMKFLTCHMVSWIKNGSQWEYFLQSKYFSFHSNLNSWWCFKPTSFFSQEEMIYFCCARSCEIELIEAQLHIYTSPNYAISGSDNGLLPVCWHYFLNQR